jgi:hypothetical protein
VGRKRREKKDRIGDLRGDKTSAVLFIVQVEERIDCTYSIKTPEFYWERVDFLCMDCGVRVKLAHRELLQLTTMRIFASL